MGYRLSDDPEMDEEGEGELVLLGNASSTPGYLTYAGTPPYRPLTADGAGTTSTAYTTGDRFRVEQLEDGVWLRYLCRKDDLLVHTSGEMTNPTITEQKILAECGGLLAEGGVTLCGNHMARPVLVAELRPRLPTTDTAARTAVHAALEKANALQPSYSAVLPQHAWLVPHGVLPRNVKGTVQRGPVELMISRGTLPVEATPLVDAEAEGDEAVGAGGAEIDSMQMTISRQATAAQLVPLHMYGVVTTLVIYSHFYHSVTQLVAGPEGDPQVEVFYGIMAQPTLDKVMIDR